MQSSISKKQQAGEFPGLSFCLLYLILGAGETNNPETPADTDRKKKKKLQEEESKWM